MINHYTVDMENPKSWDEWFYNICKVVASNSKCLSRKIGAIIVLDKTIISTGYNGPPRGIRTCDERWLVDKEMREYAAIDSSEFKQFHDFLIKNQYKWKNSPSYPNKQIHEIINKNEFFLNNLKGICPRYVPEMGFKSGEGLEWCVAGHAERNAIVNSARLGLHALKGTKIYMTCGVPCTPCLIEIINAGIEEIIVTKIEGAFYDQSSKYLLQESNIRIRTYDFIGE
jgi:deoxycytidylate deaminase